MIAAYSQECPVLRPRLSTRLYLGFFGGRLRLQQTRDRFLKADFDRRKRGLAGHATKVARRTATGVVPAAVSADCPRGAVREPHVAHVRRLWLSVSEALTFRATHQDRSPFTIRVAELHARVVSELKF
jgi:hypothetical protein